MNNNIVVTSRIRLARNLSDVPFTIKMNDYDANVVIDRVKNVIDKDSQYRFNFFEIKKLPLIKKQVLMEKHLISPALVSSKIKSAVAIDNKENLSIMINEEDHLRIQVLYKGENIQKAWEDASRIDDFLEMHLPYAYDETWGYLTSCPTNVGTGLRASFMLHLPALTMLGYMNEITQTITKLGIAVRGFYGEGSEVVGNLYQISNQITLGQPEEDIIANVISISKQLIEQEIQSRYRILNESRIFIEDRVYRAFGILRFARSISSNEALKLISDVRMGVEMGIIKEINIESLDNLIMTIQPALIQDYFSKEMTPEERDLKRAELIRKILS